MIALSAMFTSWLRVLALSAIALVHMLWSPLSACAQTIVSSCGQQLSGEGYLTADLDCSSADPLGVLVENGGVLNLRGFTVYGAYIYCADSCTVFSDVPGAAIVSDRSRAVYSEGKLELHNVAILVDSSAVNPYWNAVAAFSIRLSDVMVSGGTGGIHAVGGKLRADRLTVIGSTGRIQGEGLLLRDSTISNGGPPVVAAGYGDYGVRPAARAKIQNTTIEDSAGIFVFGSLTLKDSVVRNGTSSTGVVCRGDLGIDFTFKRTAKLIRSTVTGHEYDIATMFEPRIDNTSVCGTSVRCWPFPSPDEQCGWPEQTWGICGMDP